MRRQLMGESAGCDERHVGECGEARRACGFTTAAAHVPLDGSVAGGEEMADTAMTVVCWGPSRPRVSGVVGTAGEEHGVAYQQNRTKQDGT